jgi:hypothetical protein
MRRVACALAVAGLVAFTAVPVALAGEQVTYSADGTTLKGYIARPATAGGKRPGVLVVHEWWGNNDYTRKRADMLAELGYVALAVDMYGEGKVVDTPKEAGALSGEALRCRSRTARPPARRRCGPHCRDRLLLRGPDRAGDGASRL